MVPTLPQQTRLPTRQVRNGDHQASFVAKQRSNGAQGTKGIVQVFQDVPQDHQIESTVGQAGACYIDERHSDTSVTGREGCLHTAFHPQRPPAFGLQSPQQLTVAAADFEDVSR